MKKQYRHVYSGLRVYVYIYHDGKLVERKKLWQGDECLKEIERLEVEGYTYGFLPKEIEEQKGIYKRMLANMIEVKDE